MVSSEKQGKTITYLTEDCILLTYYQAEKCVDYVIPSTPMKVHKA